MSARPIPTEAEKAAHEVKQKYYHDNGGNKCPHCHSDNIQGGEVSIDSNVASQEVWCNDCDAGWKDIYHFFRFREDCD